MLKRKYYNWTVLHNTAKYCVELLYVKYNYMFELINNYLEF